MKPILTTTDKLKIDDNMSVREITTTLFGLPIRSYVTVCVGDTKERPIGFSSMVNLVKVDEDDYGEEDAGNVRRRH